MLETGKHSKKPFKVSLRSLHASCEANYARLLRVFPDYETTNRREFNLGGRQVLIEVIERSRYTTIFRVTHSGSSELVGGVRMDLRAYHDAAMVEVFGFQSHQRIGPRYEYPNQSGYSPDEKAQQNQFLSEWLEHCLHHAAANTDAIAFR